MLRERGVARGERVDTLDKIVVSGGFVLIVVTAIVGIVLFVKETIRINQSKAPRRPRPKSMSIQELIEQRERDSLPQAYRDLVQTREKLTPAQLKSVMQEQYEKSAKVKAHYLDQSYQDKLAAIDHDNIQALLDSLSNLGADLGLFDMRLDLEDPRITKVYAGTKENEILLMALKKLGGFYSISQLQQAFKPFNDQCEQSGQRKLRVTQKQIKDTGKKYTSNDRRGRLWSLKPIILTDLEENTTILCLLLYVDHNKRYIMAVNEMAHAWLASTNGPSMGRNAAS